MITNTQQYFFSHGCEPKGRGLWAFELTGTDGNGRYTSETYFISGTLSSARAQACKRFKQDVGGVRMITEVTVLP